jgi:hypothetical protein
MKYDDYTDDAICWSMGLRAFGAVGGDAVVRLLCKPSFHPEMCVTLTPGTGEVVALETQLWCEPAARKMTVLRETWAVEVSLIEDIAARFPDAVREQELQFAQHAMVDGMPVSMFSRCRGERTAFVGHPLGAAWRDLIVKILCVTFERARLPAVRTRIMECGAYLGVGFSM